MNTLTRHDWSRLNRLQLGKYAEYLAKIEFLLCGCDVYSSEVDDRGIDFVIRTRAGNHYDVQVKSFRLDPAKSTPYIYLEKSKFAIGRSSVLVLVQFVQGEAVTLWLVPSCLNDQPNPIFESRDYGNGKKSVPEWGLTLSKRKLALLKQDCTFQSGVDALE